MRAYLAELTAKSSQDGALGVAGRWLLARQALSATGSRWLRSRSRWRPAPCLSQSCRVRPPICFSCLRSWSLPAWAAWGQDFWRLP